MKRIGILICFLSINISLIAQKGVLFRELTFPQTLTQAKAENKLIFMDCYTVWCGPCKMMADNVFPLEEAGNYFNSKFISVKYDMEKGEGLELREKYGVKAYPTFLIIDHQGNEMHRLVGAFGLEEFIQRVERGSTKETSLAYLKQLHSEGKITNEQIMDYRLALKDAYENDLNKQITEELIRKLTPEDKLKPEFWELFNDPAASPYGSETFNFVIENYNTLTTNVGGEKVDSYLYNVWYDYLSAIYNRPNNFDLETMLNSEETLKTLNIHNGDYLIAQFQLAKVLRDRDTDKIIEAYRKALPLVPAIDNGMIVTSLSAITSRPATKEENARLADLYQEYLNYLSPENYPNFVHHNMLVYRKLSKTGVYFEPFTFEEAKQIAKNRWNMPLYVFIVDKNDSATSKWEKETLLNDEMGINFRNIVCVKYDLNSDQGKIINDIYGVKTIPTHLLLDSDGTEKSILQGYVDKSQFIEWIQEINKTKE